MLFYSSTLTLIAVDQCGNDHLHGNKIVHHTKLAAQMHASDVFKWTTYSMLFYYVHELNNWLNDITNSFVTFNFKVATYLVETAMDLHAYKV